MSLSMTRRQFVAAGAAVAGAGLLPTVSSLAAEAEKKVETGPFRHPFHKAVFAHAEIRSRRDQESRLRGDRMPRLECLARRGARRPQEGRSRRAANPFRAARLARFQQRQAERSRGFARQGDSRSASRASLRRRHRAAGSLQSRRHADAESVGIRYRFRRAHRASSIASSRATTASFRSISTLRTAPRKPRARICES